MSSVTKIEENLSNAVAENNLNKVKSLVAGFKDEGRQILGGFNFFLLQESRGTAYSEDYPRQNLHLLHVAAYYDSLECFLFLFNKGFQLEVKSANDLSPIHYACIGGSIEVASFLCDNKVNVNSFPPDTSLTPIFLATASRSPTILTMLFEAGAVIPNYPPNYKLVTPLSRAIQNKDFECISLILEKSNTMRPDQKNYSPLMKALANNAMNAAQLLIEHGADIAYQTPDGKGALFISCYQRNEDMVKFLLDHGANPNQRGFLGQYPVHWAAAAGSLPIFKLIVNAGAEVNVVDHINRPPSFSAIVAIRDPDSVEIMRMILDRGVDVNSVDSHSQTTVICLLLQNTDPSALKITRLVLEKGADLNFVAHNHLTVYETAKQCNFPEVINLIDDFLSKHPEIKLNKK